jgi:hypothetical protein
MQYLPGVMIGLVIAVVLIVVGAHRHAPPPHVAAPAAPATTVPTPQPAPARASVPPAEHRHAKPAVSHRRPAHRAEAAPAPLPYSCGEIRFWAGVLPKREIDNLAREHHVSAAQRAAAARCFKS